MGAQQSTQGHLNDSSKKLPWFETEEARFVLDHVNNNCVTVFSKSYCIHCQNTKKLFDEIGIPYKAIELNHMKTGDKVQEVLSDMTKGRTVINCAENKALGFCTPTILFL